jgi:hypothetical protein
MPLSAQGASAADFPSPKEPSGFFPPIGSAIAGSADSEKHSAPVDGPQGANLLIFPIGFPSSAVTFRR